MSRISTGSASKQNYATPKSLMDMITGHFGEIVFDLAAEPHNAKHKRYFGPTEIVTGYETGVDGKEKAIMAPNEDKEAVALDSLVQNWADLTKRYGGILWLNPPFAHIEPWVKKYKVEARLGVNGLLLVPAAVGSNWFKEYVFRAGADLYYLNGRIPFMGEGEPAYNKDCLLAHYHPKMCGFPTVWEWKSGAMYYRGKAPWE